MFPELNIPAAKLQLKERKQADGTVYFVVVDQFRKKELKLTPEEWVRQHCVHFLMNEKKYPITLLNEEKKVNVNGMSKRYDIVAYKNNGKVKLVVECKAPSVQITQTTFDQIARYNLSLNADFLMLTNGLNHYFCQMNFKEKTYTFLRDLPEYSVL